MPEDILIPTLHEHVADGGLDDFDSLATALSGSLSISPSRIFLMRSDDAGLNPSSSS
jgi:hypothetical protein